MCATLHAYTSIVKRSLFGMSEGTVHGRLLPSEVGALPRAFAPYNRDSVVGARKAQRFACGRGGAPVLARISNLCGSVMDTAVVTVPCKTPSSSRTVSRPMSSMGWLIVVRAGRM